ncbi:MAG: choice-of-anchor B family protein [candidate division Zixibacteria bacterium]|nr:choice-of-anchor B family protein [candidate division Zixibacteria bacterium]
MIILGRLAGSFFFLATILFSASPVLSRPNFNVDLLFFRNIANTRGCWGYVDSFGNEYALICAFDHLEIWDVTNPANPQRKNPVPTAGDGFPADLKQVRPYKNYVIAVNQNGGARRAAMQIIDVSKPESAKTVAVWPDTTPVGRTLPNGAHTIHIEGDSAYLGMNGWDNEWYVISLVDPLLPVKVGDYLSTSGCGGSTPQSHDSYVKNDTGYIAFLGLGFSIVDLREQPVPVKIADVCYPGAFTHNCWPTEDHQYLFTTDEEPGGHLRVWDIRNPSSPVQVAEWSPPGIASIIHNVQVKGDFLYASYYADGVVILDIEDPTQPVEVGHYDTAPDAPPSGSYAGCWDFFPYFPSGTLLASNVSGPAGMSLLRFNQTKAGKLSGKVVNWETGDSLPDVNVRFVGLPRQTKTDSSGNYVIRTEGGTVQLEFSLPNFRPETVSVAAVFNDTTEVDTVKLIPTSFLPTTPQGFTAIPADGGNIQLFWQRPPDADLVSFRIYRTPLTDTITFSLFDSVSVAETSYTDLGAIAGERHFYRVASVNPLFESFLSPVVKSMRFVFGPKLLLVNRTGQPVTTVYPFFRDTIQDFYFRALRRYDFDTLNLKDESFSLPTGIPPNFMAQNRAVFVHSAELRPFNSNDNPTFLSYFTDFFKAGGKLVMDGHWVKGTNTSSFLKCAPSDPPFLASSEIWDTLRSVFGFDCIFFPRYLPFDDSLVNRSFLFAQPEQAGYPLLTADSSRAAAGVKAFISNNISYGYPTVPVIGYLANRNPAEDLYSFGSFSPGNDPKEGQTVAKKHLNPASGGGFVWFNFPLYYMQEDSAKVAIRRALADLGVAEDFPKGDLDRDGIPWVKDVIVLLNWVFLGQQFPFFDADEADFNCDSRASAADVVTLLYAIYHGQPLPCD